MPLNFLRVHANQIIDGQGQPVTLKGVGLGGWMNMENFITGYTGTEQDHRHALRSTLGDELFNHFIDLFLTNFFTDADARFLSSLGLNALRIPINYRHFEDDMRPFEILEEGFYHLDRVIELCSQHEIYSVIDLHALPGYQNQDWHSDNPTHRAMFWDHKHFQDRVVNLWERIAERYKDNPWVAGYNLINEPGDTTATRIRHVYQRLIDAVRAVDPHHIIFLDGNRYSLDFDMLDQTWENVVYGNHDYPAPGAVHGGPYPGETNHSYFDPARLEQDYVKKSKWMIEHKLPIWTGEFGAVYTGDSRRDAMRYRLVQDQIHIYQQYGASWSLWTYKDIGLQGLVFTAPDSMWVQRIKPVLEKKQFLGVDAWGGSDEAIRTITEPLHDLMHEHFPEYNPFPNWGSGWYLDRLVRHILLAEPLAQEFAACFKGMTVDDVNELMQSFRFENCHVREPLANLLKNVAILET